MPATTSTPIGSPTEPPTSPRPDAVTSRLEILWALVVLQGAILLTTTIEAAVLGAVLTGALAIPAVLTGVAAAVILFTARGLRKGRRWSRRVLLIGEWLVIAFGLLEVVATMALARTLPDLVPLVTGIAIPAAVLWLLRSVRSAFVPDTAHAAPPAPPLADDPILGTL